MKKYNSMVVDGIDKDPVRNGLEMKIEMGRINPESNPANKYNGVNNNSRDYSENKRDNTKFK